VPVELDIVFSSTDRHTTGPITLSLTVTVSVNASSLPCGPVNTQNPTVVIDYQGGTARPTVQSNNETAQSTAGDLPIEPCTPARPVAESQMETSRNLDSAEEAVDAIKTWRSAVDVVKQVMDYVGPIVKVCLTSFVLPILR
jgi:L-asparaginase/Glu-tRNA(Gln) amidotransferase subunit D